MTTYKRHADRLPIIPADATRSNVVCHYCIVGCGYHAYSWPANRQGGTAPEDNALGADLSRQQPAETAAWYAPSMYNIVKVDGEDRHLVIKPDAECVVNRGLGSVRGSRMAEMSYSEATHTQEQRLTDPLVWRYGMMQPTSWDDALDLVARVTARIVVDRGEDALFVSAFDHGGAGGGYENTWGTGKLYFGAMKVKQHPHPQPPGLQLRGPCQPRHGGGRAQQRLRGRRARRHAGRHRLQLARDADQLLPRPLGAEPPGREHGQEARADAGTRSTRRRASSSWTRAARSPSTRPRPRPAPRTCCTSPSGRARTSRSSTRS